MMVISIKRIYTARANKATLELFSTQYRKAVRNLSELKRELIKSNCRFKRRNLFKDYEEQASIIDGFSDAAHLYGVGLGCSCDVLVEHTQRERLSFEHYRYKKSYFTKFSLYVLAEKRIGGSL